MNLKDLKLVIVNSKGKLFSHPKKSSAKMIDGLKALAAQYTELFGEEFKVKRAVPTSKGLKIL